MTEEIERELESGRSEALTRILAAATAVEKSLADYAIVIPDEAPVRPRSPRMKVNKLDGLLMLDPEPHEATGECPGGTYHFIYSAERAAQLLRYWTSMKCWAAVDLETGQAWRELPDPKTGEVKKTYVELIDPYTCPIYLCSVSVEPGIAVVFDMRVLMQSAEFVEAFREFLTTCKLIVHNSFFESIFFGAQFGVTANIAFDSLLASQVANAGKNVGNGLDAVMQRYLDIKLDKKWQEFFLTIHPTSPIPNEAIRYSAGDVCQLLTVAQKVQETLEESGMSHIYWTIEHPFLPIVANATVKGLDIDLEILAEIQVELEALRAEHHQKFIQIVGTHAVTRGKKNPVTTVEPKVSISSNAQLKKMFIERGRKVPGVAEEVLKDLIASVPGTEEAKLAQIILDWRGVDKVLGTYIKPLLTLFPNPITGKIHPIWKQLQAVTGRMACEDPAMQTIPSVGDWAKIRKAFVALPGFLIVTADYSQFELRVLAELSREPLLVEVFQKGDVITHEITKYCDEHGLPHHVAEIKKKGGEAWDEIAGAHPHLVALLTEAGKYDLHSRTAAMLFNVPLDQVNSTQRKIAKVFNFAIAYGAGPSALAQQANSQGANLTKDRAAELLDTYYKVHSVLKRFLDLQKLYASQRGWTETPAGRKRYYEVQTIGDKIAYLDRIHTEHEDYIAQVRQEVREYIEALDPSLVTQDEEEGWVVHDPDLGDLFYHQIVDSRRKKTDWEGITESWYGDDINDIARRMVRSETGKVEREGCNHPIQGANADVTKLAARLATERLQKLHPDCRIIMWVHDEIVVLCPAGLAEQAAEILRTAMIEAAERYLKTVPVDVSVGIGPCWTK